MYDAVAVLISQGNGRLTGSLLGHRPLGVDSSFVHEEIMRIWDVADERHVLLPRYRPAVRPAWAFERDILQRVCPVRPIKQQT